MLPRSYQVKNENNHKLRRNRIHLRKLYNGSNFKCNVEISGSVSDDDITSNSDINSELNNNTQHYVTRYGQTVRSLECYGQIGK